MNAIPPITDPLGKYWKQPPADAIVLDDTHALMEQAAFDALLDYSSSIPSGVYDGKMWKRRDGAYDQAFKAAGGTPEWLLMWYGPSADPNKCAIHSRKIVILERT